MATAITSGNNLSFKIGVTEYNAEIKSFTLNREDADDDFVSFAQAGQGTVSQYNLQITAMQSMDPTSFHRYLLTNKGTTAAFTAVPFGNTTITSSQPKITGTVTLVEPDVIYGGEAEGVGKKLTFDVTLNLTGNYTLSNS